MADRARIFGSEAEAYDRLRPRYPAETIDVLVADGPGLLVDAGCGTGIAARQVADRGVDVIGVEPDPDMAAVARAHGTNVTVAAFEAWTPAPSDGVYAAQSWHWIDPMRGAAVAAASIRPGGRWMACWNIELPGDVQAVCDEVYQRLAPQLLRDNPAVHLDEPAFAATIADGLASTESFGPLEKHSVHWVECLEPQRFVDRLDSHSAHRLLGTAQRERVRDGLLAVLGAEELEINYRTDTLTARRR